MRTAVIIMAGGKGTRLWPLSTRKRPKQFLDLLGRGQTLLQETVQRAQLLTLPEHIYVVAPGEYESLVRSQVPEVHFIAEPAPRNTAPTIAYAMQYLLQRGYQPADVMVVLPSDHYIEGQGQWKQALTTAVNFARQERALVTIGITPTYPATGYGYIHRGKPVQGFDRLYEVKTFTEKPPLELAKKFVESGEYLWNSGMFIWQLRALQEAIATYAPELGHLCEQIITITDEGNRRKVFMTCPQISIDYAVMEKADNVYVVEADFMWSDLGSFRALYELMPKDEDGNAVRGRVRLNECKRNLVINTSDQLVVLHRAQDVIYVQTPYAVLGLPMQEDQNVRRIYQLIETEYPDEA